MADKLYIPATLGQVKLDVTVKDNSKDLTDFVTAVVNKMHSLEKRIEDLENA
jgi:hypothetical protein